MPRPTTEQSKRDIDTLIQKLSGEFERLIQENSSLSVKLLQFQDRGVRFSASTCAGGIVTASTALLDAEPPALGPGMGSRAQRGRGVDVPAPARDPSVAELKQLPDNRASPRSPEEQALAPAIREKERGSKESSRSAGPRAASFGPEVKDQPSTASAWRSCDSEAVQLVSTFYKTDKPASPPSRISTTAVTALQECFQSLDEAGMGKISFEDMVCLLRKHQQRFEYHDLINVVRMHNQLDPLDPGNVEDQEEFSKSELLGFDFPAFMQVMMAGRTEFNAKAYSANEEACVKGLQRVLTKEAHAKRSVSGSSKFASSKSETYQPKSSVFWLEMVPTIVILLNMLVTGLSIDHPHSQSIWDICEAIFVAFYTVECVFKMKVFGVSGFFCGHGRWWNMFDLLCLQVSYMDTVIELINLFFIGEKNSSTLRGIQLTKVFRLTRLVRLVRTLRFKIFHELKLMVMGIFTGLRVLTWAVVLLVFLSYPLGVALTSLLAASDAEFDSVPSSMFTLFRCWTEGCAAIDGTPLSERLYREHGIAFMGLHIMMTMFVTVGLFNLIMAIFIDNVVNTQAARKAKEMAERSPELDARFKELFGGFLHEGIVERKESWWDKARRTVSEASEPQFSLRKSDPRTVSSEWESLRSTHATITRDMFEQWLQQEEFTSLLDDADIETTSHNELFDVLDADMTGELSMDELTNGLMRLRGPVTKADIVAVRLKVRYLTKVVENLTGILAKTLSADRADAKGRASTRTLFSCCS